MDLRTILTEVESWPAEKRLRLIEEVWESLESEASAVTLTESQKQDLQLRLDAYRDNPKVGTPWQEVKSRLLGSDG